MDVMDRMDFVRRWWGIIILTGIWGCEKLPLMGIIEFYRRN